MCCEINALIEGQQVFVLTYNAVCVLQVRDDVIKPHELNHLCDSFTTNFTV